MPAASMRPSEPLGNSLSAILTCTTAMVGSAWSTKREAADCYRKVIEFVTAHPEQYEPELATAFHDLVAKLDRLRSAVRRARCRSRSATAIIPSAPLIAPKTPLSPQFPRALSLYRPRRTARPAPGRLPGHWAGNQPDARSTPGAPRPPERASFGAWAAGRGGGFCSPEIPLSQPPEPVAAPGEFASVPAISRLMQRIVLRSTPVIRSISRCVAPFPSSVCTVVVRRCDFKTFSSRFPRAKGAA